MIPAPFDYAQPRTLAEALALLGTHGSDAKLLAGGHSLLPAMKLRLAQPKTLIDLGRIPELSCIQARDGHIAIGALTTHYQIESSALLRDQCPLLSELAPQSGDVQVRNRGTIGGSLAHADPASDWPAAILALEADLELAAPHGSRTVKAGEFFVEMMQTALGPNEILREICVPATSKSVAYVKTAQKASGFAIAGVAVWADMVRKMVRVAVTGVASKPYRATAVEKALEGQPLAPPAIAQAAALAAQGVEPLSDIHASAEFRAHLACINTRRALELALARA